MTEEHTTTTTEERPLPCQVRHKDAGGQCRRPEALRVNGIGFCEEHGQEARLGADLEVHHDAAYCFDLVRNPHVGHENYLVNRELKDAIRRLTDEAPGDGEYHEALMRAYPDPPAEVRARVRGAILEEGPGRHTVVDYLLNSLYHLHKLLRLTHKEGETWLVEKLEEERQCIAAETAVALMEEDDRGK